MKNFKKLLLLFLITFSSLIWAFDVPTLTGPVVDEAGLLDEQTKAVIERGLYDLNQRTGTQFQVVFLKDLQGESVEEASIKIADAYKLGKKGEDKSAIFLMAIKERKIRIEVGRGLEGDLTDLYSKRIIDEIRPYFKDGDYGNGLALGLSLMAQKIHEEIHFNNEKITPKHHRGVAPIKIIIALFIIIMILQFIFPSNNRFGGGGFYDGGGGFGGGGFGGGSSGGGGGWSGGGGGFSGGGASGDF